MEEYIKENLGLVHHIVRSKFKRYLTIGLYDDLFQAGILGLMEAHKRFDATRNTKFVTYAYYWVYEYMRREVGKSVKSEETLCKDPVDPRESYDCSKEICPNDIDKIKELAYNDNASKDTLLRNIIALAD